MKNFKILSLIFTVFYFVAFMMALSYSNSGSFVFFFIFSILYFLCFLILSFNEKATFLLIPLIIIGVLTFPLGIITILMAVKKRRDIRTNEAYVNVSVDKKDNKQFSFEDLEKHRKKAKREDLV